MNNKNLKPFIITFILSILLSCGGSGGGGTDDQLVKINNPSTAEHIKYMGFYWGMSARFGNHLSDFADYTNMVNIVVNYDWEHNVQMIESAIAAGLAPLIYFDARHVWLYPDWKRRVHIQSQQWECFVETITPYTKHIAGFYVFDEPTIYGIIQDTQEWIVSYYNQAFPGVKTWVTFADRHASVSPMWDVVSITPWPYGEVSAKKYKSWMNLMLNRILPHQRFAITMDAYHSNNYITQTKENQKANKLRQYFNVAKDNDRVIALYVFLYPSQNEFLGVQDMPALEDELRYIWEEIEYYEN